MAWLGCSPTAAKSTRGDRPRFPPLQRAQIVALACLEPLARGLDITHWSREDLASQAIANGIVPTISGRTIGRILDAVDLQPHRTRYWRTSRLDARFKERAEKVLWCYAQAERLAQHGIWVVCADEMPNRQVLERVPIRRSIPGSIECKRPPAPCHSLAGVACGGWDQQFGRASRRRAAATCLRSALSRRSSTR